MVMPMCSRDDKKNMFPPEDWDFKKFSDKCYQQFQVHPVKNMVTTYYGGKMLRYAIGNDYSNSFVLFT